MLKFEKNVQIRKMLKFEKYYFLKKLKFVHFKETEPCRKKPQKKPQENRTEKAAETNRKKREE